MTQKYTAFSYTLIFLILALLWTSMGISLLLFGRTRVHGSLEALAEAGARSILEQFVLARSWNAGHDRVYVPLTEETPENPYLKTDNKTVTLPDGTVMTQVNPAYMTRQFFEFSEQRRGISGKITSLKPLNPDNAPDPWEKEILSAFEKGMKEASLLEKNEGPETLRFMLPLITEDSCLRCHGEQGYRIGDIRGALSVNIPFDPYRREAENTMLLFFISLAGLAFFGYAGIFAGWLGTGKFLERISGTNEKLQAALEKNILLRREANHRIKNSLALIDGIIHLEIMEDEEKTPGEDDSGKRWKLQEIRRRILAISELHSSLYRYGETNEIVDLREFLSNLVEETVSQLSPAGTKSIIDLESVNVSADNAVNIGLLVTELLLNAIKYGNNAASGEQSSVTVRFHRISGGDFLLEISNPVGIEKLPESRKKWDGGFGTGLLASFAENLHGTLCSSEEDNIKRVSCRIPSSIESD